MTNGFNSRVWSFASHGLLNKDLWLEKVILVKKEKEKKKIPNPDVCEVRVR
jgi:hypothetical protein